MTARYLIREKRGEIITPRPDLGLYSSRRSAKRAAKRYGYPQELIHKVTRHDFESA
ncbi:hypothetical protein [Halomonas sp. 707B3]|uniref:hypothetical protein n=1 Tax=Halomonas sp. 707B3 TaxID=1681043 RepID=UPI00209E2A85|nr:hypothetical protein [Halomonas sp. 707B3]MCP1316403.1 hypothetical protein [Halomonas sp. 707B3]